ncbi:MAG TPA: hypothetical protein VJW20_03460, partial [Candidatus Angelobacter sp.]|nr:hypothetical protein [Candidatus Angelobacter sp.]
VPSLDEVRKLTPVSHRQIVKNFGGYINALQDTGLELKSTIGRGHGVPMEKLFADWAGIVKKLKTLPSINQYHLLSQYSPAPLMRRFGAWRQVPHGLKKFAERNGLAKKWKRELALVSEAPAPKHGKARRTVSAHWSPMLLDRPLYGSPLGSWPMVYAPLNELGVIFLFGAMSWQLGFLVHRVQAEFPDCEAMRRLGDGKCQLARIEFELESRNFLRHRHDPGKCDLIVCWRHNWPDCPLEVIELSKVLEDFYAGRARFPIPWFATLNPDHRKEKLHCGPQDNL